jgi:hypothetical protein
MTPHVGTDWNFRNSPVRVYWPDSPTQGCSPGLATAIHPVAALLAILAGAQLGGATDALLAVPVAGFLAVLVDEVGRRRT